MRNRRESPKFTTSLIGPGEAIVIPPLVTKCDYEAMLTELRAEVRLKAIDAIIARETKVRLDYFEIVDPDTLEPVEHIFRPTLIAVAAYVGPTRLIDNVVLTP